MIRSIVEDTISIFQQNNEKFWEDDEQIISVFEQIFADKEIDRGTDIFSIILAILTETSTYFKHKKIVSMAIWKTVVNSKSKKIFDDLFSDYTVKIAELNETYKAPLPQVLITAQKYLGEINDLQDIVDIAIEDPDEETKKESINEIKLSSSESLKQMLGLYEGLFNIEDTPYITSLEVMKTYKDIVAKAFDLIIALNSKLMTKEEIIQ